MKKLIKKLLALASVKISVVNRKNQLLQLGINEGNSATQDNYENILLKDFGFTVNYHRHRYIIDGLRKMYTLKDHYQAVFTFDDEALIIKIDGLTYHVQTFEELFILNEIFIAGVYNIYINQPFHLIDIGMNVAYTSLYFAQKPNCISVNSFEPFKPTYLQALANINLNPAVKSKIVTHQYGLGNKNELVTVTYDNSLKGNMGINGVPDYLSHQIQQVVSEEITIKNAAEFLTPIVDELIQTGANIILKVDCEGSEYDIFKSFATTNILQSFTAIILEWHFKGPDEIINTLKDNGYTFLSFAPNDATAGMIYAFKNTL
ncbi:FkbM family methyltransferase [Inquilinus sp. KBS0705]|nr:FkbM family methyltransferase [Inquilinus sp. KBS0705]